MAGFRSNLYKLYVAFEVAEVIVQPRENIDYAGNLDEMLAQKRGRRPGHESMCAKRDDLDLHQSLVRTWIGPTPRGSIVERHVLGCLTFEFTGLTRYPGASPVQRRVRPHLCCALPRVVWTSVRSGSLYEVASHRCPPTRNPKTGTWRSRLLQVVPCAAPSWCSHVRRHSRGRSHGFACRSPCLCAPARRQTAQRTTCEARARVRPESQALLA